MLGDNYLVRSATTILADWRRLLEPSDVRCYSLQKGEPAEALLAALRAEHPATDLIDLAPLIHDWGDTAALLQQLDPRHDQAAESDAEEAKRKRHQPIRVIPPLHGSRAPDVGAPPSGRSPALGATKPRPKVLPKVLG
jgi:hypothetical protein